MATYLESWQLVSFGNRQGGVVNVYACGNERLLSGIHQVLYGDEPFLHGIHQVQCGGEQLQRGIHQVRCGGERFLSETNKVLLVDGWLRSGEDCLRSAVDKVPLINEGFC